MTVTIISKTFPKLKCFEFVKTIWKTYTPWKHFNQMKRCASGQCLMNWTWTKATNHATAKHVKLESSAWHRQCHVFWFIDNPLITLNCLFSFGNAVMSRKAWASGFPIIENTSPVADVSLSHYCNYGQPKCVHCTVNQSKRNHRKWKKSGIKHKPAKEK